MARNLNLGDENDRLILLMQHEILDTAPEREYDDITWLTSRACDVPIAAVSFFDKDRVWLKSKIGIEDDEFSRGESLCEFALIDREELVVVADASKDPRFSDNRNVAGGLGIRFYASALLVTADMHVLGALTIADTKPREISQVQLDVLRAFANQLTQTLDLRFKTIQLQKANAELRNLSLKDDLTGLYNMRGLQALAEQHLRQLRTRQSETGAWVLLADLDGLKQINDRHGHHEGSDAIMKAGELLHGCLRTSDILARLGGDEFVAFMVNTHNIPDSGVLKRIEQAFDDYNATSGKPFRLSVSVGVTRTDHNDDRDLNELIRAADDAMYRNKQKNRLKSIPGFESTHIHRSVDPFMISSERLHTSGDPKHIS